MVDQRDNQDVFDTLADGDEVVVNEQGEIVPVSHATDLRKGVKTPKHTFY